MRMMGQSGRKRTLITSTYVTDGWTDIWTMDTGRQQRPRSPLMQRFVVKTASNGVNVLLHRLNNTHLLTAVPIDSNSKL